MINTGVPTSLKRPGVFSTFLYSSAGQALVPLELAALMVGAKSAAGTAPVEAPIEVFGETDADSKFGVGSELALMCRAFYGQAGLQGTQPRLFATPLAAPAGTAHAQTITLTGPATTDGNLELRIAGRPISVGIANGTAATAIATALSAQIAAKATELPVTAAVAGAVVTVTHATAGVNGAAVKIAIDAAPLGVTAVVAVGTAGSGTTDVTAALDASLNRDYDGVALANFGAADVSDAKAHTAEAWGINGKRYRHVVIAHNGTLGAAQALATASNDPTVIIATYEDCPNTPGEIAAALVAMAWGRDRPNSNYDNAVLVLYPPPAASVYKATELESALSGGLTPLRPTPEGDRTEVVRLVTTKVSTQGAPDFATFDLATTRTAAYMARQVEIRFIAEFTGADALMIVDDDAPENVIKRVRDMLVSIHTQMEAAGYIRDVDDFLPQILVEENPSVAGRLDAVNPFRVVSPLHQAAFVHHAYL